VINQNNSIRTGFHLFNELALILPSLGVGSCDFLRALCDDIVREALGQLLNAVLDDSEASRFPRLELRARFESECSHVAAHDCLDVLVGMDGWIN
jgi:hypothetical protein